MPTAKARAGVEQNGWERLTTIAFALALGLVLARGMLLEVIREAFEVSPGQEIVLRSPGAAVTTILDLLCYLPAILVGARAVFDERYRLRLPWTAIVMLGIGVYAIASTFWSADRFAAAISAGKLLAGAAVLWTMVQTVRDWGRFRIVCGLLVGLLAVNIVQGLIYVNMDLPDLRQNWEQTRERTFAEKGIEPGSFQAQQLEKKVLAGELMGFNASPNSLAALVVMISMLLVGEVFLRVRNRQYALVIAPLVLLALAGWVIVKTDSKTAFVSPLLGVGLILLGWRFRGLLARWRRTAFVAGAGGVLAGWALVIAHGMYHGTLFHRSITFRWHYWVASFQLFLDHLWRGVGWENFSAYYLQYRLPIAPEEIRDPHNLFVRFAAELGIVGLLLAWAWLKLIYWEGTLPAADQGPSEGSEESSGIRPLVVIAAIAIVLSIVAQVDFRQEGAFLLEAIRRGVYGLVMIGAAAAFCAADYRELRIDRSPSPMLLIALLAGLTLFLIHNQIDFAMFETGPFFVFVAATGALIGMRMSLRSEQQGSSARAGLAWTGGWAAVMVGMGILVTAPVAMGEAAAREADDAIAARRFPQAVSLLQNAYENSAWLRNADYLLRKSKAQLFAGQSPAKVLPTLRGAADANPRNIGVRMALADLAARTSDYQLAKSEYARAIALNPTDIGIRLDAAASLEQGQMREEALQQYTRVLELNDLLPADEVERLSERRVAEIQSRIAALRGEVSQ